MFRFELMSLSYNIYYERLCMGTQGVTLSVLCANVRRSFNDFVNVTCLSAFLFERINSNIIYFFNAIL